MRTRLAPKPLTGRRAPLAAPGRVLPALTLALAFLTPPATAASAAPQLIPSSHLCANQANHNQAVPEAREFVLRGLTGNASRAGMRCADLRHIDNRHTPVATFIDIPHLAACIRRATGPTVNGIGQTGPNPPTGGANTVYEVTGTGGNAQGVPNSATWRVVVNPRTQRITTVYNIQPGHGEQNPARRTFADCA
ncbi:hypothetical protein DMH15_21970 [Streptomyces sp. WAC 06725]|uniref:hypothetical protein n=1 Tax=Streptomyces sp. WAC 06725 TaxID=2203209 RepID=UPI000F7386F9|nr:hypothetical protein [Streptomyces sp. WAC 06725]RSO33315.1 hypothetical protein DMH15_21970 [Streptomyces sp. WAC 06725]